MNRTLLALSLILGSQALALAQSASAPQYDRFGNQVYVELPTPSGQVPPPRPVAPIVNEVPAVVPKAPASAGSDRLVVSRSQAPDRSGIRMGFEQAYRKAGAPRMAVYFNRELSDEVREWVPEDAVTNVRTRTETDSLHVDVTNKGRPNRSGELNAESQSTIENSSTVRRQSYVGVTGYRDDPREAWKWEFEDTVTNEFLITGANLVDRNLIFRLMAKNSPQTAGMSGSISTSINEVSALEKYADVLVEVLVTESPGSATGYDFRATAKEIKTGRLVGTAYVRGSEPLFGPDVRYVAGPTGYTKQVTRQIPSVADVSSLLATRLMQSMTGAL